MQNKIDERTRQVTRLWTQAQPQVSAFVSAVVRDFSDRDDLIQDIAVAVFESFDAYNQDKPFIPWAMGVARNQFKLYLRNRKRDLDMFDPDTVKALESAFVALPASYSRQLDFLHECLQSLGAKTRRLCELRYRDNLKPAAISAALSLPGTAIRKALQRVREQLRSCIEGKAAADRVTP